MTNRDKREIYNRMIAPEDERQLDLSIREEPRIAPTVGIFDPPVRCYVINHEWDAHVSGAISALAEWRAWVGEQDDRNDAVQEILKLLGSIEECNTMNFRLRQKPSNLCQLEQSFDNGETWELAFDYSLCQKDGASSSIISKLEQDLERILELLETASPETVYPRLEYDETSEDDIRDLALCSSLHALVAFICELVIQERESEALVARIGAIILSVTSAVLIATGIGSPLGLAIATALVSGYAVLWDGISNEVLGNAETQSLVACCMYTALQGATITQMAFEDSLDGCEFDEFSPESQIAGAIVGMLEDDKIFKAFVNFIDQQYRPAQLDLVDCPCEEAPVEPFDLTITFENLSGDFWTVTNFPRSDLSVSVAGDLQSTIQGNPTPAAKAPFGTISGQPSYWLYVIVEFDNPIQLDSVDMDFWYTRFGSNAVARGIALFDPDDTLLHVIRPTGTGLAQSTWHNLELDAGTFNNVKYIRCEIAISSATGATNSNSQGYIDNIRIRNIVL